MRATRDTSFLTFTQPSHIEEKDRGKKKSLEDIVALPSQPSLASDRHVGQRVFFFVFSVLASFYQDTTITVIFALDLFF